MRKWTLRIGISVLLCLLCGVAILLAWALKDLVSPHRKGLSGDKARGRFAVVAARSLPRETDDLRAIYWYQREACIFVRFTTNVDGLTHVFTEFGTPPVEVWRRQILDSDYLAFMKDAGFEVFSELRQAQEELEMTLFDLAWISPGSEMFESWHPEKRIAYKVIIDYENNTVYIRANQT